MEMLRDREIIEGFVDLPQEGWLLQAQLLGILPDIENLPDEEVEIIDTRLRARIEQALKNQGLQ